MDITQLINNFFPGWVKRPYNFFVSIPQAVEVENYWFYNISNLAYFLVALLHVCWVIVFYIMGQSTMMWMQFFSISCYILALFLNRRGFLILSMVIALAEVNLHQVVAVILLGWGTGFQNFIPLIALLPFLKYNASWKVKLALGISCLLCYLDIDKYLKNIPPLSPPDAASAGFLNISNSVLCFLLVALWGIVLALSYQRAVSALIKKEQELFASQKANEQAEMLRQLDIKERDNEIFQLRNIELKNRNNEILEQTKVIEKLITEQEKIIHTRTKELAEANVKLIQANDKLVELIQYNSHSLREPLTRVMGAMNIHDYFSHEEFNKEIWPEMERAVQDLDIRIRAVINLAEESIKFHS